jgi:hypothetical protein
MITAPENTNTLANTFHSASLHASMQQTTTARIGPKLSWLALAALITIIGLLPWWRNRAYVRSFFDYGVVMGGVGRIEDGQRPYVDFITPIQTGWYYLNLLAEKAAGGTFQAMTWSGAASVLLSALMLMGVLSRRWPLGPSAVVAGSVICATVVQHTIFWYNPWGVVLMAVVTWAAAVAPVFRPADAGWHCLIGVALFLGGFNKINMQLMALAFAAGWAFRAALAGRSSWGRVFSTLGLHFGAGVVLPICAELALTGASFDVWWHNVVALPAANRSGTVLAAFSKDFLFKPLHDYYGPLLLPQMGLVGLILSALTVAAVLRKTWNGGDGWLERFLPVVCGMLAVAGGAILLTTNMDIAYIGLAGWLTLLVALWIGYELPARGPWFYGVMVGPALLIGTVSWQSAWRGQRSQFGHSSAARSDYVDGGQAGPALAYLDGTRLPPELFASLKSIETWRQGLSDDDRSRLLYGPGTEWAARIWPALRTPGLPIYVHAGDSLGDREYDRLRGALDRGDFREITVSLVLDHWAPELRQILADKYQRTPFAYAMFHHYTRSSTLASVAEGPAPFLWRFGGNVDSRFMSSSAKYLESENHRSFLGGTDGWVEMRVNLTTNRLQGEVVVRRTEADITKPVSADFAIYAQQDNFNRYQRWSARVELKAGQKEVIVPYAIDSSHFPTTFTLHIPSAFAGRVAAGWLSPYITNVGSDSPEPVWFNRSNSPAVVLDETALARLLPPEWRPVQAQMRDGRITEAGIELSPGGEIWLKVQDIVSKFVGGAAVASSDPKAQRPEVNGFWYKAGRMDSYASPAPAANTSRSETFQAWCGEPGGWLVIAADPSSDKSPVIVRVTEVVQNH